MLFILVVSLIACVYGLYVSQEQLAERNRNSLMIAANQLADMEDRIEQSFTEYVTINDHNEDETFTDTRGSIYMELEKTDDSWTAKHFSWYPYASLEPWSV